MFCEECGEPFVDRDTDLHTPHPAASATMLRRNAGPSVEEQKAYDWSSGFGIPDQIIIHLQDSDYRFEVGVFDAPVILGRADPQTNFVPDIELSPFGAHRLGISRRHAMISWSEDGIMIEDLGSANGTYLNGHRLSPHFRRILRDGDAITLCELAIRIYFKK